MKLRRLGICLTALLAAIAAQSALASSPASFGATRPLPPAAGATTQDDAEPGMAVAPDGTIWAASNVSGAFSSGDRALGSDVYVSRDGGKTFRWVAQPISVNSAAPGAGGFDTDLTVAPEKNSKGHYTVYAASLSIADSTLAWSDDDGATWSRTPISGVPVEDRPWVAADGPCKVYVAYHAPLLLPTDGTSTLVTTVDTCDPTATRETSVVGTDADTVVGGLTNPQFGKPWVDSSPRSPHRHNLYLPMAQCHAPTGATLSEDANASSGGIPSCGDKSQNLIAVSTDGGTTFVVHQVSVGSKTMAIWPATVATDVLGTVYFVWTDSIHSYLNVSHDGGTTWSPSRRLDVGPLRAAVYPTVAALGAGRVDVAMYATTDRAGNSNDASMGKPGSPDGATWRVWVARSSNGGRDLTVMRASDIIHRGALCTYGSACSGDGSRNLLDDFGASLSPRTGRLTVVFTSDIANGRVVPSYTAYVTER
jgi:hypothetical protein